MPNPADALLQTLNGWVTAGALRALDLALARFIHQQGPEPDPMVLLAVALASERVGHGHVCLDLGQALARPETLLGRLRDDRDLAPEVRAGLAGQLRGIGLADWCARLAASPAVSDRRAGQDDGCSPCVLAGSEAAPLLYLRRYFGYEEHIRAGLHARLGQPFGLSAAALREQLDKLFKPGEADPDWQRIACALAARAAFFVITGGPGTGKTTTVLKLLRLLRGLARAAGAPAPRIALAAPTGKAAARLHESITAQLDGVAADDDLPTAVKTLHRLLGAVPDSRHFRHHAANPLPVDVVVVDEASMVDVELMAALLAALRPDTRLILLGDKDQLASVEAGAVLGDLCQRAQAAHYTPATTQWLAATGSALPGGYQDPAGTPLDQAIAMLRTSFRFNPEGGIGALAALVNAPAAADSGPRLAAIRQLFAEAPRAQGGTDGQIAAIALQGPDDPRFAALMQDGYAGYLDEIATDRTDLTAWAQRILTAHRRFQLLTPLRAGPWGVAGLNSRIIDLLHAAGRLPAAVTASGAPRQWFPGRPVLITRNDYGLHLMNGDIGITLPVPADPQAPDGPSVLRVAFPADNGGIRWVLPSRLQAVETVFAMTVHKSQGSEFTHTALILPERPNPVLTQELLYTAITRSRKRFTLLSSNPAVLADALTRRVQRVSGLRG